ncbi:N-acetylmuramic acid 6-phosphate etherase [Carnobacteriaceae bacterium zg-ZUI78]|nr:N-acetylmuramic acid 6-phosphate etherase [Carnobacteriaceae bacterium zg-ZUI78]
MQEHITETRLQESMALDTMSISEITTLINQEDGKVARCVKEALPSINQLIEMVVTVLSNQGRLIYIGAGTSGRLSILDASECVPTFNATCEMIQGIIAGGTSAITQAVEGAEDDTEQAVLDLKAISFCEKDILIGVAASGNTPYVVSALEYAHSIGAKTGAIVCNKHSKMSALADYPVEVFVGSEVLTGSTRMKAGTAQKMILNMISTTAMIKLGKVYQNLMIDVVASNEKLYKRAISIIQEATGCTKIMAEKTFLLANKRTKVAVVMILFSVSSQKAEELLSQYKGFIREIVD